MIKTRTTVTFDPPHRYWYRDKVKTWMSRHYFWQIPPGHTIKYDFIDIPGTIRYRNRRIRVYNGELEMIGRCLPVKEQYITDTKQIFDELMGRINLNFTPCRDFLSEELNLNQRLRGYMAEGDLKNPQIRIGFFENEDDVKNPMGVDELAFTRTPGDKFAADVWINVKFYEKGTLAHEIGHTLGLMHSMNAFRPPRERLNNPYDNQRYTCMSYSGCKTVSPGNNFIERTMAWVAKKHNLNLRRLSHRNKVHKLCDRLEEKDLKRLAALFTDIEIKHLGRRSSFGPMDLEILASVYGPRYKKVSNNKTFKILDSRRLDVYSETGKLRDSYGPGQILNEPGSHTLDLSDLDPSINQTDIHTHGDIGIGAYKHAFSLQQNHRVIAPFLSRLPSEKPEEEDPIITINRYQGQKYVKHPTIVDKVIGSQGHDRIVGGPEDNSFYGGNGNDKLIGGRGKNHLEGGAGNDKLISYAGDDTLVGGKGQDRFYFHKYWGEDTLTDQHGKSTLFFICCRVEDLKYKYNMSKEILDIHNFRTKSVLHIHHFNSKTYRNFNFILRNPGQKDKKISLGKNLKQLLEFNTEGPLILSEADDKPSFFFTGCQASDLRYKYNRREEVLDIHNMKTNSVLHIPNFNKTTYRDFRFFLKSHGQKNCRIFLKKHIKKLDLNGQVKKPNNSGDSVSVRTIKGKHYLSFIDCQLGDLGYKYSRSRETLDIYNAKTNDVLRINRFNKKTYRKLNPAIKNRGQSQKISLSHIKKLRGKPSKKASSSGGLAYTNSKIMVLFA